MSLKKIETSITSREIAKMTGKNHYDVLRDIREMDEKRNKYWASKQVFGDWTTIDTNRGVSLVHPEVDGFVIQTTTSGNDGTFIVALGTDHAPGGGDAGTDKGDGAVNGRIFLTIDSLLKFRIYCNPYSTLNMSVICISTKFASTGIVSSI